MREGEVRQRRKQQRERERAGGGERRSGWKWVLWLFRLWSWINLPGTRAYVPEPSDTTLHLERNRPHERAYRGDLRVRIPPTVYAHVRTSSTYARTPTDWCSHEPSWKPYPLRVPSHPGGVSRTDRPTDVIQRQRLTPPCKTIRLRSHCWGSHYLTLSIRENDLQHEDKHTFSFLLDLTSWISTRESRAQRNGGMAWRSGIFHMACAGTPILGVFFSS